jgi:hypothetical protein
LLLFISSKEKCGGKVWIKMAQKLESINFCLALVTGILVAGLGIYHGFSLLMIIIRGIGSFLLIYLLGWVLILLWEKISSPSDAPGKKNPGKESSFDFLVGDDLTDGTSPSENNKQTINDNKPAGQINMETISQMADEKAQAEILEKMVQGETR